MTQKSNQDRTHGYTVGEITTPIDRLYFWPEDPTEQGGVMIEAVKNAITYLPVKQEGNITGLVQRIESEIVKEIPLSAAWLIAADTPILHLIELFAENPDRVFLVLRSSQIIGLVAPADLNKVPARASVYMLTAQFEYDLAKLVRDELNDDAKLLNDYLTEARIKKLRTDIATDEEGELEISLFYHLYLTDLFTIVAKNERLRSLFDFRSRNHAENELDFGGWRDKVSHLTGLLIHSRAELEELNRACGKIIELSTCLKRQNATKDGGD